MNNINSPSNKKPKKIGAAHIILAISIILFVLIIGSSIPGYLAYKSAIQGKTNLLNAEKAVKDQNFTLAIEDLKKSNDNFRTAKNSMYFLSWLRLIPYAGIQYSATDHLVIAAYNITSSLQQSVVAGQKIIAPLTANNVKSVGGVSADQKNQLLKNISEASPTFQNAYNKITSAQDEIALMPTFLTLQKINDAKNQVNKYLPLIAKGMNEVAAGSKIVPQILGYPNEQTNLFLFENNSELRPGGGFIGTYGIIKVKGGELTKLMTDNVYNLDYPSQPKMTTTPPWQFIKYVDPKLDHWYLRDSNWSPDFPTDAKQAINFYKQEGGPEKNINGVIAITPTFVQYLLDVVGPIKARGETFNADNVTQKIQDITTGAFQGRVVILEQKTRKGIIGDLAKSLLGKIFLLKKDKWLGMANAIIKGFDDKQLLVYFEDKNAEKFLEANNIAGEVDQNIGSSDYLEVVDSNMASLKTDPFMERTIDYTVDAHGQATAAITYKNNADFGLLTTRYRSWTRIYVPNGSKFQSVENNEKGLDLYNSNQDYEITNELNKTVIGTFINIEPQETKTITFKYQLPKNVIDQIHKGQYNLIVQKQPGITQQNLNAKFNAPAKVISIIPKSGKIDNNTANFFVQLNSDKKFKVSY